MGSLLGGCPKTSPFTQPAQDGHVLHRRMNLCIELTFNPAGSGQASKYAMYPCLRSRRWTEGLKIPSADGRVNTLVDLEFGPN